MIQGQPRKAFTITPEASVLDAVGKMVAHNVGALAVVEPVGTDHEANDLRLVGIFTERDYLRKIIVASRASKDTPVAEVMSRALVCVSPQQRVGDALQLMVERDIRHLPVLERLPDGPLVTTVSMRQLMQQVAANHEKQVAALMAQLRKLALVVVDDKGNAANS
jgi:signal-transduction protein with cAMP-binding, CBS, and nucleotidyltransferase domain